MTLSERIQFKLDHLTKPIGSLGQLERIAKRVALNQRTTQPSISKSLVCVFAGDHGLADNGVSAFPQEVTGQMVGNFLSGGAAINVFSKQAGADFELVDCGIKIPSNVNSEGQCDLIDCRIAAGTENMLFGPAMSQEQFQQCLDNGKRLVKRWVDDGYQLIALGEMGIGNTSSAALLMSALTHLPLNLCVGRGTGHDDAGLAHKLEILTRVDNKAPTLTTPSNMGAYFSGFEIATLTGVILAAINTELTLLIDGFIVSSAALLAHAMNPTSIDKLLFAHCGDEAGHKAMLDFMNAEPILNLNLRLGEGSGAALAIPIVRSSVAMLNGMASFASAGVSENI